MTAIPLRRRLPGAFSNLPGRRDPDIDPGRLLPARAESSLRAVPIRSCSRWGLPCRLRCRRRGALLPHRFTLTVPAILRASGGDGDGGLFSVALSLGSRPPDVIRHRMSMEPGLSSQACLSALTRAAVQPTDAYGNGVWATRRQGQIRILLRELRRATGFNSSDLHSRQASRAATSAFRVARVEPSTMPSTRCGRKWR